MSTNVKLKYLDDDLQYQTIINPAPDQLERCIRLLNYSQRRGLTLKLPYGSLSINATNHIERMKFGWVNVKRKDMPRGTILDMSQNEVDTLEIKMENGQIDVARKQETITKDEALIVGLYLLENNDFPEGLTWGPSCYDW